MNSEPNTVTIIVLAGGASTRFGSNKAEAMYRGKSLLEHACSLAESTGFEVLISAPPSSTTTYSTVSRHRIVVDSAAYQGPIVALREIAMTLRGTLVVLPVDMPLLPKEVLLQLVNEVSHDAPVFASCVDKHYALCSYPASKLASTPMEISSFRQLHTWANARELPFASDMHSLFSNVNTRDEFNTLP